MKNSRSFEQCGKCTVRWKGGELDGTECFNNLNLSKEAPVFVGITNAHGTHAVAKIDPHVTVAAMET